MALASSPCRRRPSPSSAPVQLGQRGLPSPSLNRLAPRHAPHAPGLPLAAETRRSVHSFRGNASSAHRFFTALASAVSRFITVLVGSSVLGDRGRRPQGRSRLCHPAGCASPPPLHHLPLIPSGRVPWPAPSEWTALEPLLLCGLRKAGQEMDGTIGVRVCQEKLLPAGLGQECKPALEASSQLGWHRPCKAQIPIMMSNPPRPPRPGQMTPWQANLTRPG